MGQYFEGRRCWFCGRKTTQHFVDLFHCKCGKSYIMKGPGIWDAFDRTGDMVFCLHRTKKGKKRTMIRYKKSESKLTGVRFDRTTEITDKDYSVLKAIERDCPICDKVHLIEERKRSTQALIKDEIVQYEEIYYYCPLSDGEENEFVSAGLMDENLSRARNAYVERRTDISWEEVEVREILTKFTPAVDRLISEANSIAKGEKSYATMDDVFGVEDK